MYGGAVSHSRGDGERWFHHSIRPGGLSAGWGAIAVDDRGTIHVIEHAGSMVRYHTGR